MPREPVQPTTGAPQEPLQEQNVQVVFQFRSPVSLPTVVKPTLLEMGLAPGEGTEPNQECLGHSI